MVATEKRYTTIGTNPVRPDGADKVTGRAQYGADVRAAPACSTAASSAARTPTPSSRASTPRRRWRCPASRRSSRAPTSRRPERASCTTSTRARPDLTLHASTTSCAADKALYRGHAVAAVCRHRPAHRRGRARPDRGRVRGLPPVLDVREAMARRRADPARRPAHARDRAALDRARRDKPTNIASHRQFGKGDVEKGFAEADVIIEREFETDDVPPGLHRAAQRARRSGTRTASSRVWTSTQGPFGVRDSLAKMLQTPGLATSRSMPMEIGGGFGGKLAVYLEPLAALLSKKTGKPGEDDDEPRGGLRGHRPDLRHLRRASSSAPSATARSSPPRPTWPTRPAPTPARPSAAA